MYESEPQYDGATDRFWDGDTKLPRSDEEAMQMRLSFDPATDAWWFGNVLIVRQKIINLYQSMKM